MDDLPGEEGQEARELSYPVLTPERSGTAAQRCLSPIALTNAPTAAMASRGKTCRGRHQTKPPQLGGILRRFHVGERREERSHFVIIAACRVNEALTGLHCRAARHALARVALLSAGPNIDILSLAPRSKRHFWLGPAQIECALNRALFISSPRACGRQFSVRARTPPPATSLPAV